MQADNFKSQHVSLSRPKDFKPGLPSLHGKNFDASFAVPAFNYRLSYGDLMDAGTRNNKPNNYTVLQPFGKKERSRFYAEQELAVLPDATYSRTPTILELGGIE